MKEIIIVLIILIIVFSGAIVTKNYLNSSSKVLINKLEELNNRLNEKVERKELIKLSEEIYNKWSEIEENWSIIVLHDELDLIETSLIGVKSYIRTEDDSKAINEIETSKFLLNHINEKEKINLKNIF